MSSVPKITPNIKSVSNSDLHHSTEMGIPIQNSSQNLTYNFRLIAISVVFHLHKDTFDCTGGHLLKGYYIGLLTLLVISIILTAVIVYTSMQGTITNVWPRRKLSKLIYVKLAISLVELVWNILGTYWAFGKSSGCELHVVLTVKGAVLSGWVLAFIVMIGIIVVFDPLGGKKEVPSLQGADSAKRVWEIR